MLREKCKITASDVGFLILHCAVVRCKFLKNIVRHLENSAISIRECDVPLSLVAGCHIEALRGLMTDEIWHTATS
jgi:hypothetical protein